MVIDTKRVLTIVCCIALCTPIVSVAQYGGDSTQVVASAESYSMKSSQKAVDLIKSCEGFSSTAYWDYKQWTIGYGTYVASDTTYPNGITEAQGEQLLYQALETFESYVNAFLKRNSLTVTQDQFDALVCFTYAIPSWSFKGNEDYTISKMLIDGVENYSDQEVYDVFGLYVKAGTGESKVTLPGLVRRRTMEASLFLYGNTTTTVPLDQTTTTTTGSSTSGTTQSTTTTVTTPVDASAYTTWQVSDRDGVKLRHSYGLSSKKLSVVPYGTTVTVKEVVTADGYTWGNVTYGGVTGWCALDYCTQVEDSGVALDVNGDGEFTLTDLGILKAYVSGNHEGITLTSAQVKAADVDGNGTVDYVDYRQAVKLFILE